MSALATVAAADTKVGGLNCHTIEGTGLNLIFHSSTDVRCTFKDDAGSEQWYMGETGMALGIDLKWNKAQNIYLGVLSSTREFAPEGDFLTGGYAGAKAEAAVGAGAGVQVLLGGSGDTIALQPAVETSEGVGVAAGLGYLDLKSDPLNEARLVTPHGSIFSTALYSGYFDRAYKFRQQPNYDASDYFSAKAIQAAGGQPSLPDDSRKWKLPANEQQLADADLVRLQAVLEYANIAPIQTSLAQVNYDCALYALGHGHDGHDCREAFASRIEKAEVLIADFLARLAIEAEIAAMAIENLEQDSFFMVLFPTDRADFDRHGAVAMSFVMQRLGQLEEAKIFLSGNTDRSGAKQYNLELSERRIDSVRSALLSSGLPEVWIFSEAFGEENPISISRNLSDALNRRVDIVVQPVKIKAEAIEAEERRLRAM
jgi:outer membrane protein OmpA-like peptidoglycan-associated protein